MDTSEIAAALSSTATISSAAPVTPSLPSTIIAAKNTTTNNNNCNSSSTLLADILAPFAEAASIRLRDADGTLRKRIIVSLNFSDVQKLHSQLFGNDHFDWTTVHDYLNSASLTTTDWLHLISPLHFINEPTTTRQHVAEIIASTMAGIKVSMQGKKPLTPIESMRLCFARAGVIPTWDVLCKALLLCNLADVDTTAALSCLLQTADVPDFSPQISKQQQQIVGQPQQSHHEKIVSTIIKHMPTCCKHSQDEYTATFADLLSSETCHIAAHVIINSLKLRDETMERLRQNANIIFLNSQKPSLTRILEQKMLAEGTAHTNESFHVFCRATRLPSNASTYIKRCCYYALCLLTPPSISPDSTNVATPFPFSTSDPSNVYTNIKNKNTNNNNNNNTSNNNHNNYNSEVQSFLRKVVCDDPIVLTALQNIGTIINPDISALRAFLSEVQHTCEPSRALRQFRQQCVLGSNRGMNWTTVLRLYLAAYCRSPSIVKDLWAHSLTLAATTSNDENDALSSSSSASSLSVMMMMSGGNSIEAEAAVQAFVQANPPALNELLPTLI